jgi:hypothetical protein
MFYNRSMVKEFRRTGANPALNGPSPEQTGARRGEGVRKPQKRIGGVEFAEPRKRGGQPGNRNAVKTGWNTVEAKVLRSMIWQFQRQTRALLRDVRADLAARTE